MDEFKVDSNGWLFNPMGVVLLAMAMCCAFRTFDFSLPVLSFLLVNSVWLLNSDEICSISILFITSMQLSLAHLNLLQFKPVSVYQAPASLCMCMLQGGKGQLVNRMTLGWKMISKNFRYQIMTHVFIRCATLYLAMPSLLTL